MVVNAFAQGLPKDALVYSNFNSFQKIEPRLFKAWAKIVKVTCCEVYTEVIL